MKIRNITLLLTVAALLTACSNHHYLELPDPEGNVTPNPGRVIVTTPTLPAGDDDATIRLINPEDGSVVATITPGASADVTAGTYTLIYTSLTPTPANDWMLSVGNGGSTSSISLTPTTSDGCLPQAPDMEAGIATVTVTADRTIEATLTPNPMTRLVKFDARIQGADIAAIRSIETRLYGVSATSPLLPGYTAPHTRATQCYYMLIPLEQTDNTRSSTDEPLFDGTFRLLGTDVTQRQRIVVTITQTDGSTVSYEEDVTTLFTGFNPPAVNTPLHLTADISFGIGNIDGSINLWTPGWDEGGTGI